MYIKNIFNSTLTYLIGVSTPLITSLLASTQYFIGVFNTFNKNNQVPINRFYIINFENQGRKPHHHIQLRQYEDKQLDKYQHMKVHLNQQNKKTIQIQKVCNIRKPYQAIHDVLTQYDNLERSKCPWAGQTAQMAHADLLPCIAYTNEKFWRHNFDKTRSRRLRLNILI